MFTSDNIFPKNNVENIDPIGLALKMNPI